MNNLFKDAIQNNNSNMQYYAAQVSLLAMTAESFNDIEELEDVSSLSITKYEETTNITFYLKDDSKDSKLVHRLAQKFGVKFEKTPAWDKKSLRAQGTSSDGLWYFEVAGYIPATCSLVTEEIELTPEEVEEARKNVPTKKVVTKVVCA